jgi:hypothetical protein
MARRSNGGAGLLQLSQDEGGVAGGRAPATSYAYKQSLIGRAHRFELTEQGLAWHIAGRSGMWPYPEIAAVRLSYRPVSMQSRRFRADIINADGARLVILSTTWQTATLMAPQDRDYRAFIVELHSRMAGSGSRAILTGGLRPKVHTAAMVCVTLLAAAMAGLLLRSMVTGEWAGALFLVGFALLFAWQVGGFVTRNRPLTYSFDDLPKGLLP